MEIQIHYSVQHAQRNAINVMHKSAYPAKLALYFIMDNVYLIVQQELYLSQIIVLIAAVLVVNA